MSFRRSSNVLKMACNPQKNDVQKKLSSSTRFCKIILEDTLRDNKLQIPEIIVNQCGATLSSPIVLRLPCGLEWKVRLTKCDGKVWIEKGWTDFVKYYSLGHGDFLVFEYEGDSKFHVLIFDKNNSEIDYRSTNPNRSEKHDVDVQPFEINEEEDDSVEVLESFSSCPETREKSPSPCSRPKKRTKASPVDKTQTCNQSHDHRPKEGGNRKKSIRPKSRTSEDRAGWPLNSKVQAQALERATGFKSEHPFFMVPMQPTYVGVKYLLNIPFVFATKYLSNDRGRVILKIQNGQRTWPVQYSFGTYGINSKAKLEYGWKAFVKDNDLKVGDVCAFVLHKSIGILFEVTIFRKNEIAVNSAVLPEGEKATKSVKRKRNRGVKFKSGCAIKNELSKVSTNLIRHEERDEFIVKPTGKFEKPISEEKTGCRVNERPSISEDDGTSKADNSFLSTNPYFQVDFPSGHLEKNGLHLPLTFAESYLEEKSQTVILQVGERSWHVNLLAYLSNYEFSVGWSVFAKDISLRPKDVLNFELIKRNPVVFKVSILKPAA